MPAREAMRRINHAYNLLVAARADTPESERESLDRLTDDARDLRDRLTHHAARQEGY